MIPELRRAPQARPLARPPVLAGGGDPAPAGSGLGADTLTLSSLPFRMSTAQAAAYQGLDAAKKAQFDAIAKVANRPGQLALAQLLEDGRLFGAKDSQGRPMAATLETLSKGPIASGVDRTSLLSSLAIQAATPGTISQGGRGTCTVTTVEYLLASKQPAEYVRLVAGLAAPAGTVKLASGTVARRVADSTALDDSGRTEPSRLFEAAMMDVGNGPFSYSNKTDKHGVGDVTFLPGGLGNGQVARVLSAVFGSKWHAEDAVPVIGQIPYTSVGAARLMRDLKAAVSKGQSIPVGLDWRAQGEWKPSGHEVLVTKIEGGRVFFRNPWGNYSSPGTEEGGTDGPRRRIEDNAGLESMPEADFQKILKGIALP